MRFLIVVFLVASTASAPGRAVAAPGQTPFAQQGKADDQAAAAGTAAGGVSVENVRKALAAHGQSGVTFDVVDGVPTFRMSVSGHRTFMPDFKSTLKQDWQPVAPGMLYHAEFINMVTPPQARPYGAFLNGELLQVMADTMKNYYLQQATIKGIQAIKTAVRESREARARRQVEEELKALQAANAAEAAKACERDPQTPCPPPKKRPDKNP